MRIEVDSKSGYCFGVKNAIGQAEAMLDDGQPLYSLGHIVHNSEEVKRLSEKGLEVIDHDQFARLSNCRVLIRAHGEPPSTYHLALRNNITLIDATCPIVKHVQKMVRQSREEPGKNSQVVIYGKKNHPEVVGLAGQTDGTAIIISTPEDIAGIDPGKDVHLFAQTTMDPKGFSGITQKIKKHLLRNAQGINPELFVHDTICRQVSNRIGHLRKFAASHQIVFFVSGKHSSNGKFLFGICKSVNPRSYHIESPGDISKTWLQGAESIGITGATSTPTSQLEAIKSWLSSLK